MKNSYTSVWHVLLAILITPLVSSQFLFAQSSDWLVFTTDNSEIPHNNCHVIAFSLEGHTWVGSSDGLGVYKDSVWTQLRLPEVGNFPNWISSIAFDVDSNLWAGTYFNGLSSWDGESWTPRHEGNINSLLMTKKDMLWAATNDGVSRLEDSSWTTFNGAFPGMPSPHIQSITTDRNNHIWISAHPHTNFMGGVGHFDGLSWTRYNHSHGLPSNFVNEVAFDLANNLWIATNDGLAVQKGNTWTNYTTSNSGLPHNTVNSVAVSTAGHIWVGTQKGVAVWNGSSWHNFNKNNSDLPDNRVRHLRIDANGNIWIATGGGIAMYSGPLTATSISPLEEAGIRVKAPYPNPVKAGDAIVLEISTDLAIRMDMLLMDMQGRLIQSGIIQSEQVGTSVHKLKISDRLSPGQYVLQLRYQDKAQSFSIRVMGKP